MMLVEPLDACIEPDTVMVSQPVSEVLVALEGKLPAIVETARKIRVNTDALDGLRGFAMFHVFLGHCLLFSVLYIDLLGGGSMGLFYAISGFVMMLGYGQTPLRVATSADADAGWCCDRTASCCCCCCDSGARELGAPGCCFQEDCAPVPPAGRASFKFGAFIRRRGARLLPTYYLTNVAGAIISIIFFGWGIGLVAPPLGLGTTVNIVVFVGRAVLSLLLASAWLVLPSAFNPVTWSISVMVFFYFVFPSLVPRLQRVKPEHARRLAYKMYWIQLATYVGIVVSDPTSTYWLVRGLPILRLPVFVMGCCCAIERLAALATDEPLARLAQNQSCASSPRCARFCGRASMADGLALWWLIAMGCGLLSKRYEFVHPYYIRLLLELALPMLYYDLIFALTDPDPSQRGYLYKFFSTKPMKWLGHISLSLYMWHTIVIWSFTRETKLKLWQIPVCIAASIVVGWFMTTYFEVPLNARFSGKLGRKIPQISPRDLTPSLA